MAVGRGATAVVCWGLRPHQPAPPSLHLRDKKETSSNHAGSFQSFFHEDRLIHSAAQRDGQEVDHISHMLTLALYSHNILVVCCC